MDAVDPSALLRRVNDLHHEVDLLKLGLAELNARLESTLALSKISLAQFEDLIRREDSMRAEYEQAEFAGDPEEGEDLVG